jgi:hypothetical protein
MPFVFFKNPPQRLEALAEATGATRWTSLSPVSATLLGLETFGGFRCSATDMEEEAFW